MVRSAVAVLAMTTCAGLGCGARTGLLVPPPDASLLSVSGKVDLLFMIDNSASMLDKQELLLQAVPDLIGRLLTPKCIDDQGNILGDSQNGACAVGTLEFKPVPDIHIGIVTSALGGEGANECPDNSTNPVNAQLSRHNNDQGHLINRTAPGDMPLADAEPANFLAWFPTVDANRGNLPPPVPAVGDAGALVSDFQTLVGGIGQYGCGIEAQLESWYRENGTIRRGGSRFRRSCWRAPRDCCPAGHRGLRLGARRIPRRHHSIRTDRGSRRKRRGAAPRPVRDAAILRLQHG